MPPKTTKPVPNAATQAKADAKKAAQIDAANDTLNHWRRAMSCSAFLKKVEDDEDGDVANMPEEVVAEHVAEVKAAMDREAARNA